VVASERSSISHRNEEVIRAIALLCFTTVGLYSWPFDAAEIRASICTQPWPSRRLRARTPAIKHLSLCSCWRMQISLRGIRRCGVGGGGARSREWPLARAQERSQSGSGTTFLCIIRVCNERGSCARAAQRSTLARVIYSRRCSRGQRSSESSLTRCSDPARHDPSIHPAARRGPSPFQRPDSLALSCSSLCILALC
jgi:hypothetical protein